MNSVLIQDYNVPLTGLCEWRVAGEMVPEIKSGRHSRRYWISLVPFYVRAPVFNHYRIRPTVCVATPPPPPHELNDSLVSLSGHAVTSLFVQISERYD